MSLNREQRRLLQRQGEIDESGELVRQRRPSTPPPTTKGDRAKPGEFVREVRGELRKVAWPTRKETVHYSIIVLIALIVLTSIIAGLDWIFSEAVLKLFEA